MSLATDWSVRDLLEMSAAFLSHTIKPWPGTEVHMICYTAMWVQSRKIAGTSLTKTAIQPPSQLAK